MVDLTVLKDKRVLVLGSSGMLGSAVTRNLADIGSVIVDDFALLGERYQAADSDNMFCLITATKPDYIVSCVGFNGGIGFKKPFDIFYLNTVAPLTLLNAMVWAKSTAKVIFPVASCGYDEPSFVNSDSDGYLEESGYLYGEPNLSVQPHGYAKRATVLACRYAAEQYGVRAVTVCPPTLHGPKDHYEKDRSKVVAGMIRRFVDAVDDGLQEVVCWGTGQPIRDIMYVDDAASLMLQSLIAYEDSNWPMNLSHGRAMSIADIAREVARQASYDGKITFSDKSEQDGQMVKLVSNRLMLEVLGPQEESPIGSSLSMSILDYRERKSKGEFDE